MSERFRPPRYVLRLNPLVRSLLRFGVPLGTMRLLIVPGRSSGRPRSTPVSPLMVDGQRYIVAGFTRGDWVRNVRAAGWGLLRRGLSVERVGLTELSEDEQPAVLRAFPREVPGGVSIFQEVYGIEGTPEDFSGLVGKATVFRVDPSPSV